MRNLGLSVISALALLLAGCVSTPSQSPLPSVEKLSDVLLFLDPEMKVEPILFPRYLLMNSVEINRHGRISSTDLVGAGLLFRENIDAAKNRLLDRLHKKGWEVIQRDESSLWFRFILIHQGDWLELRGVQGAESTPVFLLYRPAEK